MIRNLPYPQIFGYNQGAPQAAPVGNTFIPPKLDFSGMIPQAQQEYMSQEEFFKRMRLMQQQMGFNDTSVEPPVVAPPVGDSTSNSGGGLGKILSSLFGGSTEATAE